MEFKVKKNIMLDALTKIQGITGKKTNIPITSNVLISCVKPNITIKATDLEVAFKASMEADIISDGSTAVPSRKLFEIVKEFPSDTLSVKETENKWIKIENNKVKYNLVGMEPNDFPAFPDIAGVELFEIDVNVFKNMIKKTIVSVLGDEGRAQLAGIYFEKIQEDDVSIIRMVSTDGHRLSKIDYIIEEDKGLTLENGVIIPKNGIIEVLKILEDGTSVKIGFKDNNFIVSKDDETLIIRLIEGDFPNYEIVIPKTGQYELNVNKDVFIMMLKRMSILSSDKYSGISFKIDKDQLEATTTNPEIGESKEIISLSYKGKPIEMAFNPRYFIETLNSMDSQETVVRFKDEVNPCTIEGENDPGFLSVIMPMRV